MPTTRNGWGFVFMVDDNGPDRRLAFSQSYGVAGALPGQRQSTGLVHVLSWMVSPVAPHQRPPCAKGAVTLTKRDWGIVMAVCLR